MGGISNTDFIIPSTAVISDSEHVVVSPLSTKKRQQDMLFMTLYPPLQQIPSPNTKIQYLLRLQPHQRDIYILYHDESNSLTPTRAISYGLGQGTRCNDFTSLPISQVTDIPKHFFHPASGQFALLRPIFG